MTISILVAGQDNNEINRHQGEVARARRSRKDAHRRDCAATRRCFAGFTSWRYPCITVSGFSLRAAVGAIANQVARGFHLTSAEAKAFMAIGESFAVRETVNHSSREYVRGPMHVNSVEALNARVRRTIAGVFHHIRPELADLYFHEMGFRWSQRIVSGQAMRKNRSGKASLKTLWSREPPALQLLQVFRSATGCQMRRSPSVKLSSNQ
ncbi:transposase [Rhizobium sp. PAMB 3174]